MSELSKNNHIGGKGNTGKLKTKRNNNIEKKTESHMMKYS